MNRLYQQAMHTSPNRAFNPSYCGERNDILPLIPVGVRTVLDMGCSSGTLGHQIKNSHTAEVTGVEIDEQMAQIAREKLDRVVEMDIEATTLDKYLQPHYFDCIIFADTLEHLKNPWNVLKASVDFLNRNGVVIASIPNVRHWTTMRSLLFRGEWPYRERGIHDRNHLRFFTLRNIKDLFRSSGLRIITIERNYRFSEEPHSYNKYARFVAIPLLRDLLTFQYIIVGKRHLVN